MAGTEQATRQALDRLHSVLRAIGPQLAVAVSGGVDSMTLATVAHRLQPQRTRMFHAVSAAVPAAATARVQALAAQEHWQLQCIDASELDSPDYVANPVDRCLYCKRSLYTTIARHTTWQMVSGANLDDLGDYRPGLRAAAELQVRHPLVEAEIDKTTVRAVARQLGFAALSELPASPCLSSRVQTGIAISIPTLHGIDEAEQLVRSHVRARDVRCRVRRDGIVVELDADSLALLGADARRALGALVAHALQERGTPEARVRFEPYRMGSSFVGVHR